MTAEHELDPARHLGLLGQLEQRLERARVERLAAEIEQDSFGVQRKALEAFRVGRKERLDRALFERLRRESL